MEATTVAIAAPPTPVMQAAINRHRRTTAPAVAHALETPLAKLGRLAAPTGPQGSPRRYSTGEIGLHPTVQHVGLEHV